MDDANDQGMVSELRCSKHNNADKIARVRSGVRRKAKADKPWLAIADRQAFDFCRRPRFIVRIIRVI